MLDKNYSSIYEMESYKKISKFWPDNKDNYRDATYALANVLYASSKLCVELSSDDPLIATVVVNEFSDPMISHILDYEPAALDILKNLQGQNEKKKNRMTTLEAAIMVCEAYIEKNKTR